MAAGMKTVIRHQPCPECLLCGTPGRPLYSALRDRLFDAPGEWDLKQCPDSSCGLIWLDPMPVREDIALAYKSYFTHRDNHQPAPDTWRHRLSRKAGQGYLALRYDYAEPLHLPWRKWLGVLVFFNPDLRADLDFSVFYLPVAPRQQLLEVGCGNGKMLKRMQELGWEVQGIDIGPEAVVMAKDKGLKVIRGELSNQHFPDDHFDAVVMSHVIEHVLNPIDLMRECHRILKPGGKLVLITPNSKGWGHFLYAEAWFHLDPPRHVQIFSPSTLHSLAQEGDFTTRRVFTTVRNANGAFLASWSIYRSGEYNMGSLQPWNRRLLARGMQFIEWLLLLVFPQAGEEVVMVAEK